eukprot:jgi/Orpsp1_1/1190909/evm.model.d7180000082043.1
MSSTDTDTVNVINDSVDINFENCNYNECVTYGKKIDEYEVSENQIIRTFTQFDKQRNYTEDEAINIMKNLTIVEYY